MSESSVGEAIVGQVMAEMLATGRSLSSSVEASDIRNRARGSIRPRIDPKLVFAFAAVTIVVVGLVVAGPFRSTRSTPPTEHKFGTPAGWVAYSAYGVQLSVPRGWSVQAFGECPDGQRIGTLLIGTPRFVANCPEYGSTTSIVSMNVRPDPGSLADSGNQAQAEADAAAAYASDVAGASKGDNLVINGTHVKRSPSGLVWSIPSRGVVLVGSGPKAITIMRTLTAATSRAIPVPGIVNGSAFLIGAPSGPTPLSGPMAVSRILAAPAGAAKFRAIGSMVDGHYSVTLAPGRYGITTSAGTALCLGVRVTVISGRTVTAPRITCNGN